MYYNTNKLEGETLKTATKKTEAQIKRVAKILLSFGRFGVTPRQLHAQMTGNNDPILVTSVRRCLSDLVTIGKAIKTDELMAGPLGPEHVYKWNR